jgi:hypothetical protein
MYGIMKKTTLYLPDDLKKRIETIAESDGRSEAEVIRDALVDHVDRRPPKPRLPLPGVTLGDPTIAERAGDLLDGFGE